MTPHEVAKLAAERLGIPYEQAMGRLQFGDGTISLKPKEEAAPPEYITIPGVCKDALVVHIRMDSDPRRRLCDGKIDPNTEGRQYHQCRACQNAAMRLLRKSPSSTSSKPSPADQ